MSISTIEPALPEVQRWLNDLPTHGRLRAMRSAGVPEGLARKLLPHIRQRARCWLWAGPLYNRAARPIKYDGMSLSPASMVWRYARGPLPAGYVLRSTCGVARCFAPEHRHAVTPRERDLIYLDAMIRHEAGGCWVWTGRLDRDGYGRGNGGQSAPRWVWGLLVGAIPPGQHLHHICGTRACVNPAHLAVLTPDQHAAIPRRRPRCCRNGHEFTPATTGAYPDGRRRCLVCHP